jgi:alpha-glucan phosphorylase-like protein
MVIYEMHIGTFNDQPGGPPGNLSSAIEKLPYLQELGINTIAVMPVMEFAGGFSWGYNPALIFAIESDYGGPRAFKEFVKAAHVNDIAVIFDVVYNHFGPSDLDIWQFDGWSENDKGGIYFYNDWRSQTPWGETRPDYGREEVRHYIHENSIMWLEEYRVDGLRWDMTAFALRMSGYHNGVSQRHGEVARRMWQMLWPEVTEEAPIDTVTNGVHVPTWIEPKIELLFDRYLGPSWLADHDNLATWELIDDIPDEELWKTPYWLKIKLIEAIRERARRRWAKDRASPSLMIAGGTLLDPSVLTIGFARRFATYKRPDLIFYDLERLRKLLNDRWRPIQIIFAGKAHPADDPAKRILQKIFNAACDPDLWGRIAFLEDYGEQLAQYMVHGVDVWLNNPLPPLEASGTSGMKAALNGVPNLIIMDGWWVEGFNGKNGWAFGEGTADSDRDKQDAEAIYQILEKEIIPLYDKVSDDGIPHEWVKVMKESVKSNAPRFSARRMVKEYVERCYAAIIPTNCATPLQRKASSKKGAQR